MIKGTVKIERSSNAGAVARRIEQVSLSRLVDFEECRAKAKYKHIDKLRGKDDGSPAMARGSAIHEKSENWIKSGGKGRLPEELIQFRDEYKEAIKHKPFAEAEWAFDREWNQTGWFEKNTFCRIKVDLGWHVLKSNVLHIVDVKSGKDKDFHDWQMELYNLGGLRAYPTVEEVNFQFWYVDTGVKKSATVTRADEPALIKQWDKRFKPMLTETVFKPTPGPYCRWCPASGRNANGPCKKG